MWWYVMWCYVISCHVMCCDVMWCDVMWCDVTWPLICPMRRCEADLQGMIKRYGSAEVLADHFGHKIRTVAYNERSVQCKQIKHCWLSKQNPEFRLPENILDRTWIGQRSRCATTCLGPSHRDSKVCTGTSKVASVTANVHQRSFVWFVLCRIGEWFLPRLTHATVLRHS